MLKPDLALFTNWLSCLRKVHRMVCPALHTAPGLDISVSVSRQTLQVSDDSLQLALGTTRGHGESLLVAAWSVETGAEKLCGRPVSGCHVPWWHLPRRER